MCVEKRVYPLISNYKIISFITDLFYIAFGPFLFACCLIRFNWLVKMIFIIVYIIILINAFLFFWVDRKRTLEVSDEGLFEKNPLKTFHMKWDNITKVQIKQVQIIPFSDERFPLAVVKALGIGEIVIPATKHSSDIIELLKQKLPESVFLDR